MLPIRSDGKSVFSLGASAVLGSTRPSREGMLLCAALSRCWHHTSHLLSNVSPTTPLLEQKHGAVKGRVGKNQAQPLQPAGSVMPSNGQQSRA